MSHIPEMAGKMVDGLAGALGVLATFALIGFIALLAGAGAAIYFLCVWAFPHVERLFDALALWAAGF